MDLNELRKKIDNLDSALVNLLNERASVAINIGLAKKAANEKEKPEGEKK